MTPSLPRVNTLAEVELDGARSALPSRVEDRDGNVVTIAAPDWPIDKPVGTVLTLRWTCDQGQLAVRGVVTRVLDSRLEQWVVRTDGRPRVLQQRDHDRVALSIPVTVDLVERNPPVRFTAESLDLGRGGARLRTEEWVLPEQGESVRVRFGDSEPPAIAAGTIQSPLRVRSVLEFSVALRQPVPERAALLLRRLGRKAEDERPMATATKSRWWR